MPRSAPIVRPLALRLGAVSNFSSSSSSSSSPAILGRRTLSTTPVSHSPDLPTDPAASSSPPPPPKIQPTASWEAFSKPPKSDKSSQYERSPETASRPWAESRLLRQGTPPIGSRRRRIALRLRANIPFEQLPFQCFQEARAILAQDRQKKVTALKNQLVRLNNVREAVVGKDISSETYRKKKMHDMEKYIETLKVWADINDPGVRRRFEDGMGDMNKPVYRHLAKARWQKYHKLEIEQRIKSFHIVPDILPGLEVQADVQLYLHQKRVPPGKILPSRVTEHPPTLRVQVFNPGTRLVTIVVVDADVPDLDHDSFFHRVHFIAANVPVDPTNKNLALSRIAPELVAVPWLPAHAQMGSPYHRYAIILMDQRGSEPINVATIRKQFLGPHEVRDRFELTKFNSRWGLSPFGFNIFRTVWDDDTRDIMQRWHIRGANVQLKPMRIASLRPPSRPRGWEAKRQGPKYKFLSRYTKRIRGLSTGKRWKGGRS